LTDLFPDKLIQLYRGRFLPFLLHLAKRVKDETHLPFRLLRNAGYFMIAKLFIKVDFG